MSKYVVDIDGTICSSSGGDYQRAIPFMVNIEKMNTLYDLGHTVIYFTARGMGSSGGNVLLAYLRWWCLTKKQLRDWGAKHHTLRLGKPAGDFYIDDKAINSGEFFPR